MIRKMIVLFTKTLGFWLFIPSFLTACFGIGGLKRNKNSNLIAFSFDDGPNPIYTPMLLDVLKKHQIKAAFFVVGTKAEKYPEIISRIHEEGHLIGIHNYVHKANWFMTPWGMRSQVAKTASIIEGITGIRPYYYRPPWGLMTLVDFILLQQYKIVHWSVTAKDWRSKGGSEKITSILLQKIKQGDVILLHDCGETLGADSDAPMNTIDALKTVLSEISNRGYTCVRIDELASERAK